MMRRWLSLLWLPASALLLLALGRGFLPAPQTLPAQASPRAGAPPIETAPAIHAAQTSCKPSVPLQIELLEAAETNHWTLRLQSLDEDRDVVLRMGSDAPDDGGVLWQGHLTAGLVETLDVTFEPGDPASVWASLEVADLPEGAMRAFARPQRPGAPPDEIAAETGRVVLDPETGEKVIQFTGQVEAEK